jgi:hypothetical protein
MYLINHAKDRVEILKEAFRKTYRDPNFTRNKKLTDEEPTPLMPKNHEGRSEKFPPSLK